MSQPSQLPETPPKRKNRSPLRVIVNAWGCLLALLMLAIGATLGLTGAIFFAPQLLGFNATATALADEAILLASTQAEVNFRASEAAAAETLFARDSDATRAALGNEEALLGQTATQSQRLIIATETAIAAENSRQRTRIAIDYQATQAQLQQEATAAEIDFRNAQAALGIDSSAAEPTADDPNVEAQSVPESTPAALPPTTTPAPTGVLLPASDTPSPTPQEVRIETDFGGGWDASQWRSVASAAWAQADTGAIARRDGAWLLSRQALRVPYRAEVVFAPAVVLNGAYDVLLSVGEDEGHVLRLLTEGLAVAEVEFYRFDAEALGEAPLQAQDMVLLQRSVVSLPLTEETTLRVTVDSQQLEARLNGDLLLQTALPDSPQPGTVGVALPLEAALLRVSLDES